MPGARRCPRSPDPGARSVSCCSLARLAQAGSRPCIRPRPFRPGPPRTLSGSGGISCSLWCCCRSCPCSGRMSRRCSTCPAIWAATGSSSISPRRPTSSNFTASNGRLIGNLGVDLLVELLAPLLGLELAVKLIVLDHPGADRRRPAVGRAARCTGGSRRPRCSRCPSPTISRSCSASSISRWRWRWRCLAFAFWLRLARLDRSALRAVLFVPISLSVLGRPRLRLGHARRARLLGRAGPPVRRGRNFFVAGFRAGLHCLALTPPMALLLLWRSERRRLDRRLVQLGAQDRLDADGAARPLGDVRSRRAGLGHVAPAVRRWSAAGSPFRATSPPRPFS